MDRFCCEGALIDTRENLEWLQTPASLERARAAGVVLEQRAIVFDNDKNLIVDLGCMRGVIPFAECALGTADGTAREISVISRVGKPVCFVVTGFGQDGHGNPVALLSRRAVQAAYTDARLSRLLPGDVIDCRVTHLEPFGCFCDVGRGISALLPIDYISVSRIAHPRERIYVGMDLRCAVRSVDPRGRLLLTQKELLGSWEENAALFRAGETVYGTVRSVEKYGVFVELTPNLAGLAEPYAAARPGDGASVYIKSILPERMKIKLILVDCFAREPGSIANFSYFYDGAHIDTFRYSPEHCARRIETVFG